MYSKIHTEHAQIITMTLCYLFTTVSPFDKNEEKKVQAHRQTTEGMRVWASEKSAEVNK